MSLRSRSASLPPLAGHPMAAALPALALALVLAGCAAPAPHPTLASAPGERPALSAIAHAGSEWLDLGLQSGTDAVELSGRFLVQWPLFFASREVLVQGRDASGAVLFEQLVVAQAEPVTRRQKRDRPVGFRLQLPEVPGLQSITVTVPARSADAAVPR